MSHLFISHATTDDTAISKLYDHLQLATIDTWVDHKMIKPSDDWDGKIHKALNESSIGLLALSPASAKSPECRAEFRRLLSLHGRLYVALIEPVSKEDFPWRLTTIQYVDLTENFDEGMQSLIDAIQNKSELDPAHKLVKFSRKFTSRQGIDPRLFIPIFGRDDDLTKIKTYLDSGQPTFITGVGGLGKSRMACELASGGADVDGVIWHVCSDVSRSDMVMELLKIHFDMPLDTLNDKVLERLRTQKYLIVIDNAESIDNDDRRAAYINVINQLSQAGAKVLITSRVKWDDLHRAHEHAPLPLPLDDAIKVAQAMCEASEIDLDADNLKRLTEQAYQHPRLIEFAVTLLKKRGVDRMFRTLGDLQGRKVQDALHEMILQTVDQMRDANKDYGYMAANTLKRLNVCRGGFSYHAAKILAIDEDDDSLPYDEDDLDEVLDLLVQWTFTRFDMSQNRYEIDPIVIMAVGEDESLHQVHYDYYRALADKHHEKQDFVGLEVESDNLNIAFKRKFEAQAYSYAYWLLVSMRLFLTNRARFEDYRDWTLSLMSHLDNSGNDHLKASANVSLGLMYLEYPLGNRHTNLLSSIEAYHNALTYWTAKTDSYNYTNAHNNLGNTYRNLAKIENREKNLRLAIDSYVEALRYRSPDISPQDYAMTHSNLGNAYCDLAELENREKNLKLSIESFTEALKFRTAETAPLDYAMTHNNLGNAFRDLAELENQEENLGLSIESFTEALKFRTAETAPLDYAATHTNLGTTHKHLAEIENREENLRLSIVSFTEALKYQTPETAPLDYAVTHTNLGATYKDLAEIENQEENLRLSIVSYTEALKYQTLKTATLAYATTHNNLGTTYKKLAEIDNQEENFRLAISSYTESLKYLTAITAPLAYATIQWNFGDCKAMQGYIDEALIRWKEAEKYWRQMGQTDSADWIIENRINKAEGNA